MNAVQAVENPDVPRAETAPLAVSSLHALGQSAFVDTVQFMPIVNADVRRDLFGLLKDWPDKKPNPLDELTDMELDVTGLVALGMSNKEIASRLYVVDETSRFHLTKVFTAFGIRRREHLGVEARKAGVLTHATDEWRLGYGKRLVFGATKDALAEVKFNEGQSSDSVHKLTSREWEILRLVSKGQHTNEEIAKSLCLSEDTVKFHASNAYEKLGVKGYNARAKAAFIVDFADKGVTVSRLPSHTESVARDSDAGKVESESARTSTVRRFLGMQATLAVDSLADRYKLNSFVDLEPKTSSLTGRQLDILMYLGAVTETMAKQGWVDLPALILKHRLAHAVSVPQYRKLAIEVATETARKFLSQPQFRSAY